MKLKVCGMKYNTAQVAALQPDYLGFIFYQGSKRHFAGEIPSLPSNIQKVGVFVDAPIDFVVEKAVKFQLDVIQLHGDESPEFCISLIKFLREHQQGVTHKNKSEGHDEAAGNTAIWKVFSIADSFSFEKLTPYNELVDAFLFDTKGKEKGGNGYSFNWDILKAYPLEKHFVLSGGIGPEDVSEIKKISSYLPILAIDVNSKFETAPGLKNIEDLRIFIKKLNP